MKLKVFLIYLWLGLRLDNFTVIKLDVEQLIN